MTPRLYIIVLALLVGIFTLADLPRKDTETTSRTDTVEIAEKLKQEENLDTETLELIFKYSLADFDLQYFKDRSIFIGDYAGFKSSGVCLDFYHTAPNGREYFMTGCNENLDEPIPGLFEIIEKQKWENLTIYGEYYGFECAGYKPWCVVDLTIDRVE